MSPIDGLLLAGMALGVVGAVASVVIAARLSGARALAAWLVWLPSPFIGLAMLLASGIDPSLPPERQSYNFWFGFVLIAFLLAVPWVIGNLVGALVGWRRSKSRARRVARADDPGSSPS